MTAVHVSVTAACVWVDANRYVGYDYTDYCGSRLNIYSLIACKTAQQLFIFLIWKNIIKQVPWIEQLRKVETVKQVFWWNPYADFQLCFHHHSYNHLRALLPEHEQMLRLKAAVILYKKVLFWSSVLDYQISPPIKRYL